jgi:threonine dehydrogenase-like Zn-dependent dehydrogenase
MGIVEETGRAVTALKPGDRVVVPFPISVLGVYGATFDNFPLGQFFYKGIILKGGQAPAHKHIDKLLSYVEEGKVKLDDIISHRLPLTEIAHAYDIFANREDNCVKVVLDPWQ